MWVFLKCFFIFFKKANGEIDSISCANPSIRVLAPKFKVDGITK